MLSAKLVQLIETHSAGLAEEAVHQLRADPRAPGIAALPENELRDQCQLVLQRLGHWLAESPEEEIADQYEHLGRLRLREDIPLHEAVLALHRLKQSMLDYVRAQGLAQTAADIYGEEELEHEIGRFFDSAVYHLVHGYETSRQMEAGATA